MGLVEYGSSEEARNAINTLNQTTLLGRTLFVRENTIDHRLVELPRQKVPYNVDSVYKPRVYISNLSDSVSWMDLKNFLRTGEICDDTATMFNMNGQRFNPFIGLSINLAHMNYKINVQYCGC